MSNGPAIVIEGECPSWPGGTRTFKSLPSHKDPDHDAFWFDAQLSPGDNVVGFRITYENLERMPKNTPQRRGKRLILCLKAWIEENQDDQLVVRHVIIFG